MLYMLKNYLWSNQNRDYLDKKKELYRICDRQRIQIAVKTVHHQLQSANISNSIQERLPFKVDYVCKLTQREQQCHFSLQCKCLSFPHTDFNLTLTSYHCWIWIKLCVITRCNQLCIHNYQQNMHLFKLEMIAINFNAFYTTINPTYLNSTRKCGNIFFLKRHIILLKKRKINQSYPEMHTGGQISTSGLHLNRRCCTPLY